MLNAVPSNAFAAHLQNANALADAGRLVEAAEAARQALAIAPQDGAANFVLGVIAQRLGRHEEAMERLAAAARMAPAAALPLIHLGQSALAAGNPEAARDAFAAAMGRDGQSLDAPSGLALALLRLGRPGEAIPILNAMVTRLPGRAAAHANLGLAQLAAGDAAAGTAALLEASRLDPRDASAALNLGLAHLETARFEEAIAAFDRALALQPNLVEAAGNRVLALLGQGRIEEAVAAARRAAADFPESAAVHSGLLLTLHYQAGLSAETLFAEHRAWNQRYAARIVPLPAVTPPEPQPRPLRIGYLSPDLRQHPVADFLGPVLAAHDPERVAVTCFAAAAVEDTVTVRLRGHAAWRNIASFSDAQAAAEIRRAGIDILVDLAGHTAGGRLPLMALRPAPVQVSWLGYPDTTGMAAIDYRLTDARADPPGESDRLHSESLVRLPETFLCYAPPEDAPEVSALPAEGSGRITFGCLAGLAKINRPLAAIWGRLLAGVPSSRLVLKAAAFGRPADRERTLAMFREQGVATERLDLRPRAQTRAEHLGVYGEIDIALDTLPYNGTTTTCEALWMGAPVVSCAGVTHHARVGASLLGAVGLETLVAKDVEGYIAVAASLAADVSALAELRRGLRQRMRRSPLLDAAGFARRLEDAYAAMWQRRATRSPGAAVPG